VKEDSDILCALANDAPACAAAALHSSANNPSLRRPGSIRFMKGYCILLHGKQTRPPSCTPIPSSNAGKTNNAKAQATGAQG